MNTSEQRALDRLRAEGYEVLRGGWPDFLCIGKSAFAVEVKCFGDYLRPKQIEMHRALSLAGLPVDIWRGGFPPDEQRELPGITDPVDEHFAIIVKCAKARLADASAEVDYWRRFLARRERVR